MNSCCEESTLHRHVTFAEIYVTDKITTYLYKDWSRLIFKSFTEVHKYTISCTRLDCTI